MRNDRRSPIDMRSIDPDALTTRRYERQGDPIERHLTHRIAEELIGCAMALTLGLGMVAAILLIAWLFGWVEIGGLLQ